MTEPEVEAPIAGTRASDRWRHPFGRIVAIGLIALAVARLLATDIAGIVTNDSLGYLRRSADPFGEGFVTEGYRQVAYPLSMWVSNRIADVFGWDHILGMALVQRVLLAVALGVCIWSMRWWSVPVVLLATSSTYVVHTDFLLPEGMLIPLSVLAGALVAAIVMGRASTPASARLVLVSLCAVSLLATAIKLQYAVLIALCVAGGWLLVRDRLVTRRAALAFVTTVLGLVASMALVQSVENRHEYGVFEPISERSLAEWYGAWTAMFRVHPERADDPALAQWYDDGYLYRKFDAAKAQYPVYTERRKVVRSWIDEMFVAADTSAPREHGAAFLGALRGGRTDDLAGFADDALASGPGSALRRVSYNGLAESAQIPGLLAELNDAQPPGFVSFGPVLDRAQHLAGDHRDAKGVIATASILAMLAGLVIPGRHRIATGAILVSLLGSAVVLATGYIDNARYLLGPLTVTLIGGVLAVRGGWLFARARRLGGEDVGGTRRSPPSTRDREGDGDPPGEPEQSGLTTVPR